MSHIFYRNKGIITKVVPEVQLIFVYMNSRPAAVQVKGPAAAGKLKPRLLAINI